MKNEKEIEEVLEKWKSAFEIWDDEDISEKTYYEGWIKALYWVLSGD